MYMRVSIRTFISTIVYSLNLVDPHFNFTSIGARVATLEANLKSFSILKYVINVT